MKTLHLKPCSQLIALLLVVGGLCSSTYAALSPDDRTAIEKTHAAATAPVEANPTNVNWAAFVDAHYDAHAKVLPADGPLAEGRDAIITFFSSLPRLSLFKTNDVEIDGDGSVAYVRGTYTVTLNPPDAEPFTDTGKYIQVWRKRPDGSWRCVLDIFNSDLPESG